MPMICSSLNLLRFMVGPPWVKINGKTHPPVGPKNGGKVSLFTLANFIRFREPPIRPCICVS